MRDFVQRRGHSTEAVGGNSRRRVRQTLVKETQGKHARTDDFMTVWVSRSEMIGSNCAGLLSFEGHGRYKYSVNPPPRQYYCLSSYGQRNRGLWARFHHQYIYKSACQLQRYNRPTARDSSFIHISVKPFQVCRLFEGRCKPNYTYRSEASGR